MTPASRHLTATAPRWAARRRTCRTCPLKVAQPAFHHRSGSSWCILHSRERLRRPQSKAPVRVATSGRRRPGGSAATPTEVRLVLAARTSPGVCPCLCVMESFKGRNARLLPLASTRVQETSVNGKMQGHKCCKRRGQRSRRGAGAPSSAASAVNARASIAFGKNR